jgi:hypothetical protein
VKFLGSAPREQNAVAAKLVDVPLLGNIVRRNLVMISYAGRRSGQRFTTPLNCRQVGDEVVIRVGLPGAKNWWRDFLGNGGPITLPAQRHQPIRHAVASRDDQDRVTVTVKLDDRRSRHSSTPSTDRPARPEKDFGTSVMAWPQRRLTSIRYEELNEGRRVSRRYIPPRPPNTRALGGDHQLDRPCFVGPPF